MNITCDVIADLLPLYLDGMASEDTKKVISAHLKGCRTCRESLRTMERGSVFHGAKARVDGMADYAQLAKRMRTRRTVTYSAGGALILGLLSYSVYKTIVDTLPQLQTR